MIQDADGEAVPVIAVIPARGGSKGVPGKNIRPLGGVPLVARTVNAAIRAVTVDRVYVSTDDPQIAFISEQHGAVVIDRPKNISGDTAPSESALLHVVETLIETGWQPDGLLVFLQCTSPFTVPADIDGAVTALVSNLANTSLTVSPFHYFLWSTVAETQEVAGINHDKSKRLRRQDRQPHFLETGAVYVMNVRGFVKHKHRFFGRTVMYEVPAIRSLEIDTLEDFQIAEAILSATDGMVNRGCA